MASLNISESIAFHQYQGHCATLAAVQPPGRFGSLQFERSRVLSFEEKTQCDGAWINGGFFVLEPQVLDLIEDNQSVWERDCLPRIATARAGNVIGGDDWASDRRAQPRRYPPLAACARSPRWLPAPD